MRAWIHFVASLTWQFNYPMSIQGCAQTILEALSCGPTNAARYVLHHDIATHAFFTTATICLQKANNGDSLRHDIKCTRGSSSKSVSTFIRAVANIDRRIFRKLYRDVTKRLSVGSSETSAKQEALDTGHPRSFRTRYAINYGL